MSDSTTSMGITWDANRASVDPVASRQRKKGHGRLTKPRSWVRLNGGAFKADEGDLKLCR